LEDLAEFSMTNEVLKITHLCLLKEWNTRCVCYLQANVPWVRKKKSEKILKNENLKRIFWGDPFVFGGKLIESKRKKVYC
jgi:hypothetical protein